MKLLNVSLLFLLALSQICSALSMTNETCIGDKFKPLQDILQNVSVFPEDNRALMEIEGKKFGLRPKETEQIRSALGEIYCPGTTYGNPSQLSGVIMESKGTLATNYHAFYDDEKKVYREPLSECVFATQAELSAGSPGHKFKFGTGDKPFEEAEARKDLVRGHPKEGSFGDDYVVIKLDTTPAKVTPLKLPKFPLPLYSCDKENSKIACQKLIGITAHSHIMPDSKPSPWGKTVIQSFELRNVNLPDPGSNIPRGLLTNESAMRGMSGGLVIAANADGTPMRVNGELVPVGITVAGAKAEYNGKAYDKSKDIDTELAGFDGDLANAIKVISESK